MRWGRLRRRTLCPLEIDAMKDACYASPHAATSHKGFGDSRQDSMVKLRIAHSAYSSRWPWPLGVPTTRNDLQVTQRLPSASLWRVGRPSRSTIAKKAGQVAALPLIEISAASPVVRTSNTYPCANAGAPGGSREITSEAGT